MTLKVKVIPIMISDTLYKATAIEEEISKWLKGKFIKIMSTDMVMTDGRNVLYTIIYKEL